MGLDPSASSATEGAWASPCAAPCPSASLSGHQGLQQPFLVKCAAHKCHMDLELCLGHLPSPSPSPLLALPQQLVQMLCALSQALLLMLF